MVKLYVIKSEKNGDLYVGICLDLNRRLDEHEKGKNRYTKGLRPWKLLHFETFSTWESARRQEKYYKSGSGKEKLKFKLKLVP